jgi:hypothetical protein
MADGYGKAPAAVHELLDRIWDETPSLSSFEIGWISRPGGQWWATTDAFGTEVQIVTPLFLGEEESGEWVRYERESAPPRRQVPMRTASWEANA